MSFNAVICQNYFFQSPLILFSAVLRIRLILVCCVIVFLLWIQGETTHFLQIVFYYVSLGQTLFTFLKEEMAWIPLILGSLTLILRPFPRCWQSSATLQQRFKIYSWGLGLLQFFFCYSHSNSLLVDPWWSAAQTGIQSSLLHTSAGFEFCGYKCSWSVLVLFLPGCGKCLQALCKVVLKCNSTSSISEEPQCFSEKSQQTMCDWKAKTCNA